LWQKVSYRSVGERSLALMQKIGQVEDLIK
jgi:hypothetical protein